MIGLPAAMASSNEMDKPFAQTRQHHQIAGGQKVADISPKAEKRHPVRDPAVSHQALKALAHRTFARDGEAISCLPVRQNGGGLDEMRKAFVGRQAGCAQNQQVTVAHLQLAAKSARRAAIRSDQAE